MKILVTGSNGQLGLELKYLSQDSSIDFVFKDKTDLDITSNSALKLFLSKNSVDIIVNCAAYTAVDKAEDEIEKAYLINQIGVKNIVHVCSEHNIKLIHFSTDYVFDGCNFQPYNETDNVSPQGVYGKSKLAGEQEILESNISALIIRTSWLYSRFGHNFVKSMIKLGRSKRHLNVVFDQIGTPTHAFDLAKATLRCVSMQNNWLNKQEIYHFSNEGVASWYDFTLEIFEKYSIDCNVKPILSKDFPTKAKRPHFSVLDKCKFKRDFNYDIRHWRPSFKDVNFNI